MVVIIWYMYELPSVNCSTCICMSIVYNFVVDHLGSKCGFTDECDCVLVYAG